MSDKIERLLQLQELDIIQSEAQIVHDNESCDQQQELERKITELRAGIDAETLSRYDRLIKQGSSVVHVRSGLCTGCHLAVPQGDLNRMIAGKMSPICPNCGRFLHIPSE